MVDCTKLPIFRLSIIKERKVQKGSTANHLCLLELKFKNNL